MIELINYFTNTFPYYKQVGWSIEKHDDVPYLLLTLCFTVLVFSIEWYLDFRQLHLFNTIKVVPKELVGTISDETFHKSNRYGADKFRFGIFESGFSTIEALLLVLLGYLPFAWDLAESLCTRFGLIPATGRDSNSIYQEIVRTAAFMVITTCHDTLFSLPFSLYRTFVVEEKHGFNKTTLSLFLRDKVITLGLTVCLGVPVLSIVVWLVRWGGDYFYFYVWMFLFVVTVVMMTLYPTLIAPLFNKYDKLESGPLYDAIEELAKKVSFPLTQIFVVDGSKRSAHSNAYFYGFFKSKRIVLFDTLIKQVEMPELLAILGHEIGHWRLWHTVQGFFISQAYIFVLFLSFSWVQHSPGLFSAFGFAYGSEVGAVPVVIGLMLFSQTFWSPVDKTLTLIMNFNSRANEFAADRYALDLGMGAALGSGLVKISVENLGNMVPDELYSAYHFSHPPLVERLRALQIKDKTS